MLENMKNYFRAIMYWLSDFPQYPGRPTEMYWGKPDAETVKAMTEMTDASDKLSEHIDRQVKEDSLKRSGKTKHNG